MNIEELKSLCSKIILENDLILYDLKWIREYNEDILQILVDKKGGIDLDTLADINEKLSNALDNVYIDKENYLLEVSSPGAEKELRTKEEIIEAIDSYIYVETNELKLEGYLLEANLESIKVRVNLKGRMKNFDIRLNDIKFIRLAVKI